MSSKLNAERKGKQGFDCLVSQAEEKVTEDYCLAHTLQKQVLKRLKNPALRERTSPTPSYPEGQGRLGLSEFLSIEDSKNKGTDNDRSLKTLSKENGGSRVLDIWGKF